MGDQADSALLFKTHNSICQIPEVGLRLSIREHLDMICRTRVRTSHRPCKHESRAAWS